MSKSGQYVGEYILLSASYSPSIIFLDFDGVLNCQVFYEKSRKEAKKNLRKTLRPVDLDSIEYRKTQVCPDRISWLSDLCRETNSDVVITSTWRKNRSIQELQDMIYYCGGDFRVIGKTESLGFERGVEIAKWLRDYVTPDRYGCHYFDFHRYAIIDDDSDMLLNQRFNFFQTDEYSGLTPNICYRIKRFLTGQTFGCPSGSSVIDEFLVEQFYTKRTIG